MTQIDSLFWSLTALYCCFRTMIFRKVETLTLKRQKFFAMAPLVVNLLVPPAACMDSVTLGARHLSRHVNESVQYTVGGLRMADCRLSSASPGRPHAKVSDLIDVTCWLWRLITELSEHADDSWPTTKLYSFCHVSDFADQSMITVAKTSVVCYAQLWRLIPAVGP